MHDWAEDGDEWKGQAKLCGLPYGEWKASLIDHLINPAVKEDDTVVEIAPGHGRWTGAIASRARRVLVVDLSPNCIQYCRKRFTNFANIEFYTNDGRTLPFIPDASVDFVWSYDSFVHMPADVISSYFKEFCRILKPNGLALVHHAGRRHSTLWLGFLMNFGYRPRRWYQRVSMGSSAEDLDGWRSNVSRELVVQLAKQHGLYVEEQFQGWGPKSEYSTRRFNDWMTRLRKS